MDVSDAIRALGGATVVGNALGTSRSAVTNIASRRQVSRDLLIPLWCLALERGVPWTPPGGERLAALLRAAPPEPATTTLAEAA